MHIYGHIANYVKKKELRELLNSTKNALLVKLKHSVCGPVVGGMETVEEVLCALFGPFGKLDLKQD